MDEDRDITATFERENEDPNSSVSLINSPGPMFSLPAPNSFGNPTSDNFRFGVLYRSEDVGSTKYDVFSGGLHARANYDFSGTFTADAEAFEISDSDQVKDAVVIGGISGSQIKYKIRGSGSDMLETQTLVERGSDNVPGLDVASGSGANPLIATISFESGLVHQFSYNSGNQQYEIGTDFTVTRENTGGEDFFDLSLPLPGFTDIGDTFGAVTSNGSIGSLYKFELEGDPGNLMIASERQDNVSEYVTDFPLAFECAGWDSSGNSVCAVTNNNGSGALLKYSSDNFSVIAGFTAGVRSVQPALKRMDNEVMFAIPDGTTDTFLVGTVLNDSAEYERMDAPAGCLGPTRALFGPETAEGQGLLFLGCDESENIHRMEIDYDY